MLNQPNSSTTYGAAPAEPAETASRQRDSSVLFAYYTRRRDGERPLSITAGTLALLTLWMGIKSHLQSSDIRPVMFYGVFWLLSTAACVLLALQWRNETVAAHSTGLEVTDCLRRSRTYPWAQVRRAVDKQRPDTSRFIIELDSKRTIVLHDDLQGYPDAVQLCRSYLSAAGRPVETDSMGM